MASQFEPSNVIPSKIEPLHREIPGVGQGGVETSTKPEPGYVPPFMVGLKWAGFTFAAAWVVPFFSTLAVARAADWFGGPVGKQILIGVVTAGVAGLAGAWAGRGRTAWRFAGWGVAAGTVVSVLMLVWATSGETANKMPLSRTLVVLMGVGALGIVAGGVLLGTTKTLALKRATAAGHVEPPGTARKETGAVMAGIVGAALAQLALGGAWICVARAMGV
jgi:hypothetical protein